MEKRIKELKRWRMAAIIIGVIAMMASVWGFFYPFIAIVANNRVGANKDILVGFAAFIGGAVIANLADRVEVNASRELKKIREIEKIATVAAKAMAKMMVDPRSVRSK